MDFFFADQIRRYLLQFIRIFSDLKIQETRNGAKVTERVPVMYGDPSRMVASILKGNSENTVIPSPIMSVWIRGLQQDIARRQDPMFISKKNIIERSRDQNGELGTEIGNQYSLERYMPVPYVLQLQLDIWTTSTTTKLQLVEQIGTWFNDRIQLQQSTNVFDWTCLMEVILTNIEWSSRTVPQGTTSERDVASLSFDIPIWLNPPAKLMSKKWIDQVVVNVKEVNNLSDQEIDSRLLDPLGCFRELSQLIVAPDDIHLRVFHEGNSVKAELVNTTYNWSSLLKLYNLEKETTEIYLKTNDNIESSQGDIIARMQFEQNSNVAELELNIDTIPADSVRYSPISAVVNPVSKSPGNGLPLAVPGQRYLITSSHDFDSEAAIQSLHPSNPWGVLVAFANDIIEFDGTQWKVIFNSRIETNEHIITNLSNSNKYKFVNGEWIYLYQGTFNPGYWRLYGTR